MGPRASPSRVAATRAICGVMSGLSATTSPVAGSTKRSAAARAPSPSPRASTSRYSKAGVMMRSYPQRSNSASSASAMARRRAAAAGRKSLTPTGRRMGEGSDTRGQYTGDSEDDPLRRLDVGHAAHLVEERVVELGVDLPQHERIAARAAAAHVEPRHVDAAIAEQRPDAADDAGTIGVADEQQPALGRGVEDEVVDLHDARLGLLAHLEERAHHRARAGGAAGAHRD